jgi:hypothetical protein
MEGRVGGGGRRGRTKGGRVEGVEAEGAMLVRPRQMCPQLGCCIPWTKCPLSIVPLTEPSHP